MSSWKADTRYKGLIGYGDYGTVLEYPYYGVMKRDCTHAVKRWRYMDKTESCVGDFVQFQSH